MKPPEPKPAPGPLIWIGDLLEAVRSFPPAVRDEIGFALYQAQTANKHVNAKPLRGFGPGVLEVISYTVRLAGKVYVLHAFQKKSKSGIATPKAEIELVKRRLKRAVELHAAQGN